jgi:hypothetical protein
MLQFEVDFNHIDEKGRVATLVDDLPRLIHVGERCVLVDSVEKLEADGWVDEIGRKTGVIFLGIEERSYVDLGGDGVRQDQHRQDG